MLTLARYLSVSSVLGKSSAGILQKIWSILAKFYQIFQLKIFPTRSPNDSKFSFENLTIFLFQFFKSVPHAVLFHEKNPTNTHLAQGALADFEAQREVKDKAVAQTIARSRKRADRPVRFIRANSLLLRARLRCCYGRAHNNNSHRKEAEALQAGQQDESARAKRKFHVIHSRINVSVSRFGLKVYHKVT